MRMTKTNATLPRDVSYRERIAQLIDGFPLPIDKDVSVEGRAPTSATSEMKELDSGRRLFHVKFDGGTGYLDVAAFRKAVGA